MGQRINYERANRREAAAIDRPPRTINRKAKTTQAQRQKLYALGKELGREVTVPQMAYDAALEIDRLSMRLDTKKRMGV
jgi:hypothetical protein